MSLFRSFAALSLLAAGTKATFDPASNDNVVLYWGQNSVGLVNGPQSQWQQNISYYCQDNSVDVIPMLGIEVFYDSGGLPYLDLANTCNNLVQPTFGDSDLIDCSFMAPDIQFCQDQGKKVLISIGGAGGYSSAGFASAEAATKFGTLIWNLFLGGTSDSRPFGDAVLDGLDLQIQIGDTTYFNSMISAIRTAASGYSKDIYISGSPSCVYPDPIMATALNTSWFDFVWPRFYDQDCSLSNYPSDFDFSDWNTWATSVSINPEVKLYIGTLASSTAGTSGYADQATVIEAAQAMQSEFPATFGGVMLWDASQAVANDNFQVGVKSALVSN